VPVFIKELIVNAPVERLFAFHERPDALELLSPAFPPLNVLRRTGGIGQGAEVDLRIGPITWHARHIAFEQNRLFVDEQVRGPFRQWVHRHEFEALDAGRSKLTDRVEFQLPGGAIINAIIAPFVRLGLGGMFAHRHGVTRAHVEGVATEASHR
jgi:ligand-binding SRPBCC domain-containing protein